MSNRYEKEKAFHDERYQDDTRAAVNQYYAGTRASWFHYADSVSRDCTGKSILEYGCGTGSLAFELAEKGARVKGIDISETAIEMARKRELRKAGLTPAERGTSADGSVPDFPSSVKPPHTPETDSGSIDFQVMNAEALSFEAASFDVVCGTAILHHLDLEVAARQLAHVLKPNGRAIFSEPLGHNPLINAYRKRTPHLRTEDEHPLLMADLDVLHKHFGEVRARYFHLTSLATLPFRRVPGFRTLLALLDGLDTILFKLMPFLRRFAWVVVLECQRPKRETDAGHVSKQNAGTAS